MKTRFQFIFIHFFVIIAGCALFIYFAKDFTFDFIAPVVFFVLCVTGAEFINVVLPRGGSISVSSSFILAGLLLFPLPEAVVIAGVGTFLPALIRRKKLETSVFVALGEKVIVVSASAFVFTLLGGKAGVLNLSGWNILPLAGISATYFLVDVTLDQVLLTVYGLTPFFSAWLGTIELLGLTYLALVATGILMALIYQSLAFWGVLLFFFPLLVTRRSFKLYIGIKRTYLSTIRALATAIEAQGPRRRGHAKRVADYAVDIGREMGVHGDQLEMIGYAALLHDIGKLGMEEDSFDEFLEEKKLELRETLTAYLDGRTRDLKRGESAHAVIGAEIVEQIDCLKDISDVIRQHHTPFSVEDLNRGEKIPLAAKIINLASYYDELTQMRPAEERYSSEQALAVIRKEQGFHFDPTVVRALMNVLLKKGKLAALN